MNELKKTIIIIKKSFAVALLLSLSSFDIYSQWANDPSSNTKLVVDPFDPLNITALSDFNNGAYIVWQDKKGSSESDIYFIHFDKNGKVSFRSDGKVVSTRSGRKENPGVVVDAAGNTVVIWKGIDKKNNEDIFLQKVNSSGLRLWQNEGIQLTNDKSEKTDYALHSDKRGYLYVSYISKSISSANKYSVKTISINPSGKLLTDSLKGTVFTSGNTISETEIVSDNKGGKFILWLENVNQKTVLRSQYVDSLGSKKWGKTPLTLSKPNSNVINYNVGKLGNSIYVAVTYQGTNKIIYQSLISDKGKLLWGNEGKLLTYQKGSQINPQFAFVDSSVVVCWTNEFEKVKDVFIQRFDISGKRLWGNNGKRIINIKGNQFGQKIVYDQKDGIIVAWIDKRDNKSAANLYTQKLDLRGNFKWDSSGVILASSTNLQKSYINLLSDAEGGAVAVFKGTRDNKNDIFGQKIFSTGTYAAQIIGFDTEVVDDSVKVFWYAANEFPGTTYKIYRSSSSESEDKDWKVVGTVNLNKGKDANYYEFYDWPDINGSVYYKVIQSFNDGTSRSTEISKVDYFRDVELIVLGQNSPNPFSDSTVIRFFLPESEKITFEFYNNSIEIVKTIENVVYPAGKNEIIFNAEKLPAGIYFYRLKVGNFVDVKKMVITD